MTKIAIIDLETTGLDPAKHEILELACVLIEADTLREISRYEARIIPKHLETADVRALEVNGYSSEMWENAIELSEALLTISKLTSYAYLLGYNVSFDYGFLKAAYDQTGIKDESCYQRLDLLTLAWFRIPHLKLLSWKMKEVARYLEVPPEPAVHRAMNGVECAYAILKKLTLH